jgi:1-acyl-sn-glycerol-3-phosphate acyltransferase
MGLFDRMRGRRGGAGDGGRRQLLDREATPADLEHLRVFVRTRAGVEFYVEPETTATDTTVVAVAKDGEWTRRRVGTPKAAARLARKAGVPIYDVTVTGYPEAMRRWNARAKADREALERMDREGP